MVVLVLEVNIDKQTASFEQEPVLFSGKSYVPEVYFLEQRAKLFLLVLSLVLHGDSESVSLVLNLNSNSNGLCTLYKSATSISFSHFKNPPFKI